MWTRPRRTMLPAVAAALLVAGTLLPWRTTGHSSTDGWRTADLLLGLGHNLGDDRLRVVAGVWYLIPFLAVSAPLALSLLSAGKGRAVGLALAASSLVCALATAYALGSQRLVSPSPIGPIVVVVSALLLTTICWTAPRHSTATD